MRGQVTRPPRRWRQARMAPWALGSAALFLVATCVVAYSAGQLNGTPAACYTFR